MKNTENFRDVNINADLSACERSEIRFLLSTFENVLTDEPDKWNLMEHSLPLVSDEPLRSKPYSIPLTMQTSEV